MEPTLNANEWNSLKRFYETCEDDGSYDISDSEISRLVELGMIRKIRGSIYETTDLGMKFLNG